MHLRALFSLYALLPFIRTSAKYRWLDHFVISIERKTKKKIYIYQSLILAQRYRIKAYYDSLSFWKITRLRYSTPLILSVSTVLKYYFFFSVSFVLSHLSSCVQREGPKQLQLSNNAIPNSINCTLSDFHSCLGPRTLAFRYNYTAI